MPFPCPEEVKAPLIDSSVAFYASTPMECQMKSINMKAYANVWADIGVCFPLFDKIYKNLPGPVVLNSDHWCFDKSSTNASPVFREALAMKHINGIGKKKNTGIKDGNKKKDNTGNKNKKKKQNMRNRKKGTRDGGQDTNDRKLYSTLSEFTDYWSAYQYEDIELE
jgi:transcription initiation factor TFIIIB Brf1 subunit/transcription initiation factor TFIIB